MTSGISRVVLWGSLFALSGAVTLAQAAAPSPAGAEVFIESPKDGDVVTSPVKVKFGIKGMELVPAGMMKANAGHHHLVIDADLPPADKPVPPNDTHHMHFGKAQTEAEVTLPPGKHTLQLMLGDHAHMPHHPVVSSKKITIEVK